MRNESLIAAVVLSASATAFGAGVGHLVGGIPGAAVACSLAAMALLLGTANHVSALTAARAVAAMTATAGVGTVMDGFTALDWKLDATTFGDTNALAGTLIALMLRGAVRVGLPAALFAAALSGRSRWLIGIVAFAAILVAFSLAGDRLVSLLSDSASSTMSRFLVPPHSAPAEKNVVALWGSALAAILGAFLWIKFVWNDDLCFRMGLWGLVAGGLALPTACILGCIAGTASGRMPVGPYRIACEALASGMTREAIYGLIWGAILGWGVWRNRVSFASTPDVDSLRLPWEIGLLVIHVTLSLAAVLAKGVGEHSAIYAYGQSGVLTTFIPLFCSFAGRRAPWLVALPVVAAPAIGLAVRHGVYDKHLLSTDVGWIIVVAIPVALSVACAVWASVMDAEQNAATRSTLPISVALFVETFLLLGIATVLLDFSWPWRAVHPHTALLSLLMGCVAVLYLVATPLAMASAGPSSSPQAPPTMRS